MEKPMVGIQAETATIMAAGNRTKCRDVQEMMCVADAACPRRRL